MTALKFNKVKTLPTSGYNVGDVFFVSSEKKIYIRTASGWEKYVGDITTEDIVDGAVTEAKIADGSITGDKFSPGLTLYMNKQFNYLKQVQVKYGEDPSAEIKSFAQRDNKTALYVKLSNGLLVPANTNGETVSGLYSYGNTVRKVLFDGTNWSDVEIQNDIIDTAHIKDRAVTRAKLELGSVGSGQLDQDSVNSYSIQQGAVKNSHIYSGAVNSEKLAKGARKPIIFTPDTTEVDEETYQKLLSDDVDVVFKTSEDNICVLTYKVERETSYALYFTCFSVEGESDNDNVYLYGYEVTITKDSHHTCNVIENFSNDFSSFLTQTGFLHKNTLSRILKEIDLTGTDEAERKAKLDQFETDWKALTGASDLTGARFVGKVTISGVGKSCLFTHQTVGVYDYIGFVYSIDSADRINILKVGLEVDSENVYVNYEKVVDYSHLEAITIKAGNTTTDKADNIAAIRAYVNNLKALGVDTTKGYMIPVKLDSGSLDGFVSYHSDTADYPWSGLLIRPGGTGKFMGINKDGLVVLIPDILTRGEQIDLTTTSKLIVGAINEVNSLAGTAKSTADTANSNATSAKTAVDGLAENVSTSKITFAAPWGDSVVEVDKTNNNGINLSYSGTLALPVHGIATPHNDNDAVNKKYVDDNLPNMEMYAKIGTTNGGINGIGFTTLFIGEYGNYAYLEKSEIIEDPNEPTGESITGIQMRGAGWQKRRFTGITHTINDTDAANKSYVDTKVATKQDKLISGTNIKTVNYQSLLGSGNITVGSDVSSNGDNTFTGNNIFETYAEFKQGMFVHNENLNQSYYLAINTDGKFWISNTDDADVEVTGVDTPTQDNAAANKKYVDDKVAAAGGGSAPVLIDIDEITGSAGDTISVDIFNTMANAANAKTPVFGYYKLVESTRSTYEIIPLSIKLISNTSSIGTLAAQYIRNSAYNSVVLRKLSDTECNILTAVSRTFALDTSVDKSSTRGIQSSAVWKEIHSEPITFNTATSGVTTLSSTSKHKILCYADSGTQQYNLPTSPVDGETFMFLKVKSGHTIIIQSGTGNANVYDCSSGNSVISKTVASSTRRKITVTYSSSAAKWFLMADDFLS